MGETILVADNEPDILRFVEVNLRLEGFQVVTCLDGQEALDKAFALRPSLVLLDVMMPRLDGFEVCRRLRADVRTSHIPIIFLTAKSMTVDKVLGLTAGADGYVVKPFDPIELVARVTSTMKRAHELRGSSPLTGLPGNHRITAEIAERLARGEPMAVVYADLNDFKAYNDRYGFVRGDEVIVMTADVLSDALRSHAGAAAFVGHIGGDDFMFVCEPDLVEQVCKTIVEDFDRRITRFYDREDRARGYVEVPDRQNDLRKFPFVSISLGVAATDRRDYDDHRPLIEVAHEMKSFLKRTQRKSSYAIDERIIAGPVDPGSVSRPQSG
jgi:diguanylate cyclase (GGDEF)-like protein